MRTPLLWLASLACGCNSSGTAPDTCVPYSPAVAAAAAPSSNCPNECVDVLTLLGDAGAAFLGAAPTFDVCAVNCTSGGQAACGAGMTCLSLEPVSAASYCVTPCSLGDAGLDASAADAGSCPSSMVCTPAGFCL